MNIPTAMRQNACGSSTCRLASNLLWWMMLPQIMGILMKQLFKEFSAQDDLCHCGNGSVQVGSFWMNIPTMVNSFYVQDDHQEIWIWSTSSINQLVYRGCVARCSWSFGRSLEYFFQWRCLADPGPGKEPELCPHASCVTNPGSTIACSKYNSN